MKSHNTISESKTFSVIIWIQAIEKWFCHLVAISLADNCSQSCLLNVVVVSWNHRKNQLHRPRRQQAKPNEFHLLNDLMFLFPMKVSVNATNTTASWFVRIGSPYWDCWCTRVREREKRSNGKTTIHFDVILRLLPHRCRYALTSAHQSITNKFNFDEWTSSAFRSSL